MTDIPEGQEDHIVYQVQKECPDCGWSSAVIEARPEDGGLELRIDKIKYCPYCGTEVPDDQ
jgi:ribosomal protein S27AE